MGMKMAGRTTALLGTAALLAVALLVAVSHVDDNTVELVTRGNNAKLLSKLNNLLMQRLEARTNADKVGGPDSRFAEKGPLKMTKAELEQAACNDGEPCKLKSQMPILKYIPSSGNWDVVSAGNPDVIWASLMNKAKSRDKVAKSSPRTQELVQVDTEEREAERKQLEAKLKSLLKAKMAKRRASFSESFAQNSEDQGDANGPVHTIKQLASDLHESRRLVESRHDPDTDRMQRVEDRLSEDYKLHSLCRHRHMVVEGLGVLKHSSLEGCVRQLKYRMGKATSRLKSAVAALAFEPSHHGRDDLGADNGADGDRYASLHARKHRLSQELSTLEKDHSELQEELKQQKERITQLTQSKKNAAHSSAQGSSPPAPPGLPPGYNGPLLGKGSTHVPLSRPPGM